MFRAATGTPHPPVCLGKLPVFNALEAGFYRSTLFPGLEGRFLKTEELVRRRAHPCLALARTLGACGHSEFIVRQARKLSAKRRNFFGEIITGLGTRGAADAPGGSTGLVVFPGVGLTWVDRLWYSDSGTAQVLQLHLAQFKEKPQMPGPKKKRPR